MPRIKDERLRKGKLNRDKAIRAYFDKRWADGMRYDVIEEEIVLRWGVSVSAITRIMKGDYDENKENQPQTPDDNG